MLKLPYIKELCPSTTTIKSCTSRQVFVSEAVLIVPLLPNVAAHPHRLTILKSLVRHIFADCRVETDKKSVVVDMDSRLIHSNMFARRSNRHVGRHVLHVITYSPKKETQPWRVTSLLAATPSSQSTT